ncbi:hypothetical protein EC026C_30760 [Escherichia coli]
MNVTVAHSELGVGHSELPPQNSVTPINIDTPINFDMTTPIKSDTR